MIPIVSATSLLECGTATPVARAVEPWPSRVMTWQVAREAWSGLMRRSSTSRPTRKLMTDWDEETTALRQGQKTGYTDRSHGFPSLHLFVTVYASRSRLFVCFIQIAYLPSPSLTMKPAFV